MPLPKPELGLVLNYAYLWHHQHERGLEEGTKDRPCVIVSAVSSIDHPLMVTVAPITHLPPHSADHGIELPAATKQRLGMDDHRSWIVCHDLNRFRWPGPDLRPISGRRSGEYSYGFIPPNLFEKLQASIFHNARNRRIRTTPRQQ